MDAEAVNFVTNIATQLPLLVLFVWYNDRMLKMFRDEQDKRDAMYLDAIARVSEAVDRIDNKLTEHDQWERGVKLVETPKIDRIMDQTTQRRRASDK